jgi:enamine deaminase RidA (YjgF/YER057c/UK114 family)
VPRRARARAPVIERSLSSEHTQLGEVLPPDDFDAQAKMVMANLTKALAAGGAKIADVTKITIYICNPHDVPKARGLLQTYFAGAAPASTLCILRGLANPNFLLEIEPIAAV